MSSLVQEAKQCLSVHGGRMTAQRRLILETLEGMSGHPSAEELYERLQSQSPELNLSTVYRTLRWLEGEGLVGARRFGEGRQERFDLASPAEHHHFVCTSCGRVIEFRYPSSEAIKLRFEKDFGVSVDATTITLYGLCQDCRR